LDRVRHQCGIGGSQVAAPDPIVLANQSDDRLFSPSERLDRECIEVDREDVEISKLTRLYSGSSASDDLLP